MNWDQIQGNWIQIKGNARQTWGDLTDRELEVIEGKREKLIGKLQETYSMRKEYAEKQVDNWAKNLTLIGRALQRDARSGLFDRTTPRPDYHRAES